MSDSPLAGDAVNFADREFRKVAVVAGLPLLLVRRGAILVGFTNVGESNNPNPPSRYLKKEMLMLLGKHETVNDIKNV